MVFAMLKLWFGFVIHIPPIQKQTQRPKIGFQDRTKCPYFRFCWIGLCSCVSNGTIILLGRRTPVVPGEGPHRMSKNQHHLRNVCTHSVQQQRGGGRLAWQMVCAAPSYQLTNAWPMWRGHVNARPPRRPTKSCGQIRRRVGRMQMHHR